ncbi:PHP domain-containing protein [Paenibacillus agricola]|uniref:PHP domain-containing protein n=1 Tax=Paenibacillus agricola TaxID=2716264 RepID=A0ABX0J2W3_9BACL|nr:PHP domain-containing protein [Paenibacillus agricola]NHN28466.1 PHP domain-containing protein [Paenibacillus agricola]
MLYADLHSHTFASDGMQTPTDNVRIATEAGLGAIAITDHDTVAGVDEALTAGKELGILVVPGVEISTVSQGEDIHILGYWMDHHNEQFLKRLAELRSVRDQRNEMMLEQLNELGVPITMEEVRASLKASKKIDETLGRPHIADALLRKGHVATIAEAFDRYLGKDGAAYVNPPRIEPSTAIRWIKEAGGVPVLAHPGLYGQDELIEPLVECGLAGIEVYHADHTPAQEVHYLAIANKHQLIATAGSDFHGERNGIIFHSPIGSKKIDVSVVQLLLKAKQPIAGRDSLKDSEEGT